MSPLWRYFGNNKSRVFPKLPARIALVRAALPRAKRWPRRRHIHIYIYICLYILYYIVVCCTRPCHSSSLCGLLRDSCHCEMGRSNKTKVPARMRIAPAARGHRGPRQVGNPHRTRIYRFGVFRAYPRFEIRQTVPCRAMRGSSILVNSTLPPLLIATAARGRTFVT